MYYCSVILLKGLEEFKISIICSLNGVLLFIIHENIFRGGLKSEKNVCPQAVLKSISS